MFSLKEFDFLGVFQQDIIIKKFMINKSFYCKYFKPELKK